MRFRIDGLGYPFSVDAPSHDIAAYRAGVIVQNVTGVGVWFECCNSAPDAQGRYPYFATKGNRKASVTIGLDTEER